MVDYLCMCMENLTWNRQILHLVVLNGKDIALKYHKPSHISSNMLLGTLISPPYEELEDFNLFLTEFHDFVNMFSGYGHSLYI